ncbi:MAG: hypothetical protein CSA24_00305 [Deltaproteobacteria bacterium]|nr:MAG: hypothetical protein CSA24_00305 [Deltaproteobacteria bacterium]
MSAELAQAHDAYLERVKANLGDVEVGGYAKVQGRLIKVLAREEFDRRFLEYQHVQQAYEQSMARGDTVNDAIVQLLHERAAELLLDPHI